ncbi:DNA replication and repair protein RecO [Sporobacter termitidis DSM 10068]|uniref:DNA repair protein RecO n=1 Tax=Sporobacter termitidis DSM 10068 TaxID=1123282 RepID=A0A1M5WZ73_9FIRM|nr:DNA repair protein RecO [Sporobacter termitidis]SHH92642.1 DNA replication and repair protein RecO [Sporobacter termitidis DSM 10068]
MYINTTGLVLRVTDYKDASRIMTVLTSTEGKLTVSARGAMRRGSKFAAAVQPLAYSDMTLYQNRDRWTLTEAQTIELFSGVSGDVRLLALGSYVAELLEAVSDEDSPNPEILSLGLNALYMLSRNEKDPELVKAAFEIRLMCLAGFEPVVSLCAACGREDVDAPRLDLVGGTVLCHGCRSPGTNETAPLCRGSLDALRYIVSADPKKMFSFKLDAEALSRLSRAAGAYVSTQLDRKFKTLEFYKQLK